MYGPIWYCRQCCTVINQPSQSDHPQPSFYTVQSHWFAIPQQEKTAVEFPMTIHLGPAVNFTVPARPKAHMQFTYAA